MLRKIIAIDLTPCNRVATEAGLHHFPVREVREFVAGEGVDVIETLVTLVERVPEDNAESIASTRTNFTRTRHALEDAGARVIPAPAKRLPNGEFKQSDDQRLVIATLSLALRLRPDFVVLAAADGDFAPLVWELRDVGIRTEVVARADMLASDLRRAAYSVIDINSMLNLIGGAQ